MSAAARHFLHDGFERTSLDRIAADAKVSKQAIYASFRDKEDLFDQVVRANLTGKLAAAVPGRADAHAALEAVAMSLSGSLFAPRNFGLFRANILAMQRMPGLSAAIRDYRRTASSEIACLLEALAVQGRIDGPAGQSIHSMQWYETDASRGFVRGAKWNVMPGGGPLGMRAAYGGKPLEEAWGANLHKNTRKVFGRTFEWGIIAEDLE